MTAGEETTLDVTKLGEEMIDAARAAITGHAPPLRVMAEFELRCLAGTLADIGSMLARGEIDPDSARQMANIHQLSVRSVLRSVEGLSLLAAEHAMAAVTRVAAGVVNRVVGFRLL